jgi:hypothetical protein
MAGGLAPSARAAESIAVNAGITYQTMTGWEATGRAWEIDKNANAYNPTFAQNAPAVADRMVNELGVNRLQLVLKSGWMNPVDYWTPFVNGQLTYTAWVAHSYEKIAGAPYQFAEFDFYVEKMLLPMRQQLQARGEKLYVNMIFTDFDVPGRNGNFAFSKNPAAYTAFVKAYVDRLRTKYGVMLDAFEVSLEPENTDPANPWGGVQLGQALVALRGMFSANGYPNLNLIAPSVTNASNTIPYLKAIETVPGAMAALTTVSYHRYASGDYAAIRAYAQARGKKTAMAEWIHASVDTLFDDLLITHVSSWQKWAVASRGQGSNPQSVYYTANVNDPTNPVFAFAPKTAPLSLFFRYVRMGAVRVDAQSATMRTVAFVNTNGTHVVVARRSEGSGTAPVMFAGLKPGAYGVRTIGASSNQPTDLPDVAVPANGIVTVNLPEGYSALYGKNSTAPITLVEYRHAAWDYYFMTGDPVEIGQLDSGAFVGWARTGYQFKAYPSGNSLGSDVCRFFSTSFAPRSSHFYTASPQECSIIGGNPDWSLEGTVFGIAVPDASGTCAPGTASVYRMYNNGQGGAPNHRYTTDAGVRAQMLEQGWVAEGYGTLGVVMCSPD